MRPKQKNSRIGGGLTNFELMHTSKTNRAKASSTEGSLLETWDRRAYIGEDKQCRAA